MSGALPRRPAALLVDLDGTLTDPFIGITESMRHALAALGRPVPEAADLAWCIGPPLVENMRRLMPDADEATVWKGVAAYRERYGTAGAFENAVYDGIPEALDAIRAAGIALHLATSKLEAHAIRIVRHFGLADRFASLHGSQPDGSNANKADLIAHILADQGLEPACCAMVGDRKHDVIGAAAHGIPTVGVLWGYGGRGELTAAGAAVLAETPGDLPRIVLGAGRRAGGSEDSPMTDRLTWRVVVSGRVQGVGYREWTRRTAEAAGLEGWVRNRRDGTVEAVVAGDAGAVRAMVEHMRAGPRAASVTRIETEPVPPEGRRGFEILPSV